MTQGEQHTMHNADADGELESRAMLFKRDMPQAELEEQHRRVVEKYDRALRNIYDEVYELNVTQDVYRIVYHVEDKYVTPPSVGVLTEAIGMVAQNMIHPLDRAKFMEFFDLERVRERISAGEEFCIEEFRKLWVDGLFHWASLTLFPLERGGEDDDEVYLVFIMDIDERRRTAEIVQQNTAMERQRLADERYKIIVEQTQTLVFEWSTSPAGKYTSPELIERFAGSYDHRDLFTIWSEDQVVHPEDLTEFTRFLEASRTSDHVEIIVRLRLRERLHEEVQDRSTYIWCKVGLSILHTQNNEDVRFIGTLNDVDAATRSVQALQYRAEYDPLTGICNMQTFYRRAEHLIRFNPESQYYVIRMDIDRFKVINDLFGLEEGDRLLKTIAKALADGMNADSVCARMSGDVFCACVDFSRTKLIEFITGLGESIAVYPLTSRIVPSFGIVRVDNTETPVSVLCDWANLALKTVKGQVLHYYAFYDETLREHLLSDRKIESSMHAALLNREFCLYLQPKVDIQTSTIVGAEALVRWNNPEEGLIAPDSFIPLFERNGFIIQLDEFIWEETCKVLRAWLDAGLKPLPVSVNVSRMHIHDTRFCEKLPRLLAKYNLPPQLLELELTESVFLDNADQMVAAINQLREQGFVFSLDDFGAGYSSLNMLKSLPIQIIKIDRGFLTEVVCTERGKTVIRHIIALAKALDMQVVAEGVENQGQAAFLLEVDCELAQGYHYSRPIPVSEFEQMAFTEVPQRN